MTSPGASGPTRRKASLLNRFLLVAAGMSIGAVFATIGTVELLDVMLGNPACEPNEAAGCGAGVVLLALTLGTPMGAIAAALVANRLIR